MGTISAGIGLVSGINTAELIAQLISLEAQGKIPLQQRVASLQAQKTALLDINARLLNLKSTSGKFRNASIFSSTLANSTNADILGATAGSSAVPGSYQFIVKQLVSTSQELTKGFASTDTTPLGLDSLTFEFGNGALSGDTEVAVLNGGNGIDRGDLVITDSSGSTANVDLGAATTINEVIAAINEADGVNVSVSIEDDHLVVIDNAGGAGALTIANGAGDTNASDLGIAGSNTGSITGTDINVLGLNTALASLNDGAGIFLRDNVADFVIDVNGYDYAIDLGRVDAPIDDDTLLSDLNNGTGVKITSEAADFLIVDKSGTTHEINLGQILDEDDEVVEGPVTTVAELKDRVSDLTGGAVTLDVNDDGNGFKLVDVSGGGGDLEVLGAGVNGTETAEDLGLLGSTTGTELVGSPVPNKVQTAQAATLQDVVDRINAQTTGLNPPTDGLVTASIAGDGKSIQLDAGGGATITIEAGALDGSLIGADISRRTLEGLGFTEGQSGTTVQGERILSGFNTRLLSSLNGGVGLGGATSLTISDRENNEYTLNNIDNYDTVAELIDAINTSFVGNGVSISASVSSSGMGIRISNETATSPANLTISGDVADALGLTADVAKSTVQNSNLQLQYVSEATSLASLNYGQGIGTGEFTITDSTGASATVSIGSDSKTLYDIIQEINSRGLEVEARVNENGDGLVLIDTAVTNGETPIQSMSVVSNSGSTAKDLGILGQAETVGGNIDGSYEKTVALETLDTLDDVVEKINEANVGVAASILNTGTGGLPYHLSLTSEISGSAGNLAIDAGEIDLGLTTLSEGQDAKVFFGSSDPADGLLIKSSTNTISTAVQGVTLNLQSASDEVVTVSVTKDTDKIVETVSEFVAAFNDVIGRINDYDKYDVDTEEKGVLLGNPTVARVRNQLYTLVQGPATGLSSQFSYLTEVGIQVGANGELKFDQAKFLEAYEDDPEAVENLFAAFEQQETTEPEEIAPGVTIESSSTTTTALGFGDLFDQFLEGLTDSIDGVMTLADNNFQDLIDLTNDRIEQFDQRLDAKQSRLEAEFTAMEIALAQLQSQQNALASLNSAVLLATGLQS
jgi:flagellar hook-associated protein 2